MLSSCLEDNHEKKSKCHQVIIGNQEWNTENLNVETFRNGDPIPWAITNEDWQEAGDRKQPAWCYYENDPKNEEKYGKLYNWYAVNDKRGLAPNGFHIPSDKEWQILIDYLGGETDAAEKMKKTSYSVAHGWFFNSGKLTNISGFSGDYGFERYPDGTFMSLSGGDSYWWSSTDNNSNNAWIRSISYNIWNNGIDRYDSDKKCGYSVRCIKD